MRLSHILLALLVTFIWGTNFVFIKVALNELAPFVFASLRFLAVAFPLILLFPKPNCPWWMICGYGLFIGFGQFGILFFAMDDNITPGLASLVIQSQAFMTVALSTLFFREKIGKLQLIALAVSLAGLVLIAANTHAVADSGNKTTLFGLLLILIAALSWAMGNLLVKKAGQVNIVSFLVWSSLFAVPPLFAMSYFLETMPVIRYGLHFASLETWAVVFWQSFGNTLIGYGLWNYLLRLYPAATVTPWALLVPVFGLTASAVIFEEPLQSWKIAAAMLILLGLAINSYASMKRKR